MHSLLSLDGTAMDEKAHASVLSRMKSVGDVVKRRPEFAYCGIQFILEFTDDDYEGASVLICALPTCDVRL